MPATGGTDCAYRLLAWAWNHCSSIARAWPGMRAWFNGISLGRARSMRPASLWCPADMGMTRELLMCFRSLTVALQARRPRPRWRVPMLAHQQLRWFRTSLLGRAPGWSPPWPPIGPAAGRCG